MKSLIRVALGVLVGFGLVLGAGRADARELHWSSIRVAARLDADGVLHVAERQTMVFTGDWNGGERGFRLGGGQEIELDRLTRIEPASGARVELVEGDLDRVDHYDWVDGNKLRWRSRLPSEPWFDETTFIYLIEYRLTGVLIESGSLYRLDHDFAFPDRPGQIESFTLDLDLDPIWMPSDGLPTHLERNNIPPGLGVLVAADLAYTGTGRPAGVRHQVPVTWINGLFAAVLAGFGVKAGLFWRNEVAQGRYESVELPAELNSEWLEENLLGLLPEEAGALWDRRIGPPEVAAVLARMVAEGKLASRARTSGKIFKRPILELDLEVSRSGLEGYELKLVDELFFDGRTSTDTKLIREHYKSTGLNLVKEITPPLEKRMKRIAGLAEELPKQSPRPTRYLFLGATVLTALEAVTRGMTAVGLILGLLVVGLLPLLIAYSFASAYKKRIQHPHLASMGFFLPLLLLIGGTWLLARVSHMVSATTPGQPLGIFGLLAAACFAMGAANSVINMALTRESLAAVRARKVLAGVRRLFRDELRKPEPYIHDEWFPYLMAFGLQSDVDKWFHSFGGSTTSVAGSVGAGSASTGRPVFTGGGGSFGGAGASATWAAAATGMGAGVAPPGSSGSSGGGGGGGGSSGGGSGGGW